MTNEHVQALVSEPLRSRVMVASALSAIAESEARDGDVNRAWQTALTVRQLMSEIRTRLGEPNALSTSAVREAADLFAELEGRIVAVEAALAPRRPIQ